MHLNRWLHQCSSRIQLFTIALAGVLQRCSRCRVLSTILWIQKRHWRLRDDLRDSLHILDPTAFPDRTDRNIPLEDKMVAVWLLVETFARAAIEWQHLSHHPVMGRCTSREVATPEPVSLATYQHITGTRMATAKVNRLSALTRRLSMFKEVGPSCQCLDTTLPMYSAIDRHTFANFLYYENPPPARKATATTCGNVKLCIQLSDNRDQLEYKVVAIISRPGDGAPHFVVRYLAKDDNVWYHGANNGFCT